MPWEWSDNLRNFVKDGSELTRAQLLSFSEQSVQASVAQMDTFAAQVASEVMTPAQWRAAMRDELKQEYIRQYVLARGGRPQMTAEDWGSVGGSLAEQYRWLEGFSDQVATGNLTEAQIKIRTFLDLAERLYGFSLQKIQRAAMYANSAREAFYRGRARALGFGPEDLPYFPCDGNTPCLTRCNCDWEFVAVRNDDGDLIGWDCYWKLGSSVQHCTGCLQRAAESAPYEIRF